MLVSRCLYPRNPLALESWYWSDRNESIHKGPKQWHRSVSPPYMDFVWEVLYYTSCKHPSKRPVNCKPKSLDRSVWFSPKKNQTLTNYRIQETKSVWGATTVRGPQSSSVGTSIAWRRSFNKCFCSWMTLEALVTCQDSVHNSSASVMICDEECWLFLRIATLQSDPSSWWHQSFDQCLKILKTNSFLLMFQVLLLL